MSKERLPYYPVYELLMKLPSFQVRQGGAMVVAADVYKLVRQATLREVGEWIEDHRIKGLTTEFYISLREIAKLKNGSMPE